MVSFTHGPCLYFNLSQEIKRVVEYKGRAFILFVVCAYICESVRVAEWGEGRSDGPPFVIIAVIRFTITVTWKNGFAVRQVIISVEVFHPRKCISI